MKPLSRTAVEERIDQGEILVIYQNQVLKLDHWLARHPGGDKAILHLVGRDGTDEMDRYHAKETTRRMKAYAIGQVAMEARPWRNMVPPIQCPALVKQDAPDYSDDEGIAMSESSQSTEPIQGPIDAHTQAEIERDLATYPSLDATTQGGIQAKYRALADKLEQEGYYQCRYSDYLVWELARYVLLATASLTLYSHGWYKLSAVFLGLFWHQVTLACHDLAHNGVTHGPLDTIIGMTLASFVGGLSIGWWKRNHNVHHLVTNQPEHDPDIQHMPIFAVTPKLLTNVTSTYYEKVLDYDTAAQLLIKVQRFIFYPIMLFGRFNLYRLSLDHILFNRGPKTRFNTYARIYELLGMCVFGYWYCYLLVGSLPTTSSKVLFVLISHWVTAPLHVQITLSHFAMSTADLGPQECFAQQQLRTTMDIDCPPWMDPVHGGLQFQAIHHLFPRIPRHRLREVQPFVKQFAKETGVPHKVYGFAQGNGIVLGRLAEVSAQAKLLASCAATMRQHNDLGFDLVG
ncbi:fatty acid desaturase [Protomyces lactucae-debilis]|uniref:Delta 8-(E)-sphingolipid desaturase n=1 Tax=Protomyces lactucae-debilis TaxID=2754530 RepID=A0A1Y2FK95_PROLT|nr:fatty acid desaturase [Protomyces lactucae-debilis]ORY84401.1 fatty acid desaturase [Protomyces lactucae-debilis]